MGHESHGKRKPGLPPKNNKQAIHAWSGAHTSSKRHQVSQRASTACRAHYYYSTQLCISQLNNQRHVRKQKHCTQQMVQTQGIHIIEVKQQMQVIWICAWQQGHAFSVFLLWPYHNSSTEYLIRSHGILHKEWCTSPIHKWVMNRMVKLWTWRETPVYFERRPPLWWSQLALAIGYSQISMTHIASE